MKMVHQQLIYLLQIAIFHIYIYIAMLVYQRLWYNTYMCVSKIGMILMGDISTLSLPFSHHRNDSRSFPRYALAVKGPVVVSPDAAGWETYGGGVYDNCPRNAAVNHAVLAVGYGKSAEGKYWIIRSLAKTPPIEGLCCLHQKSRQTYPEDQP